MSQRALTLPIRTLASRSAAAPQWICRRCLATQTQPTVSITENYRDVKPSDLLSKKLPQRHIPNHYLQHINAETLPIEEQELWEKVEPHKKIVGVVVSHGKIDKTVRVRLAGQRWNQRIKKYFRADTHHLVHDPNNSLHSGDVVELHRLKVSRRVEHVVASIISPFGQPVDQRPPVPTPEERFAAYKQKRFIKLQRRELRVRAADGDEEAIKQLKDMGFDPGAGAKPGVRRNENVQPKTHTSRNPGKGAILGEKGQKLPEGVLPGGKEEVGSINERSFHNQQQASKFDGKAKQRRVRKEAKEKAEELDRQSLGSVSGLR